MVTVKKDDFKPINQSKLIKNSKSSFLQPADNDKAAFKTPSMRLQSNAQSYSSSPKGTWLGLNHYITAIVPNVIVSILWCYISGCYSDKWTKSDFGFSFVVLCLLLIKLDYLTDTGIQLFKIVMPGILRFMIQSYYLIQFLMKIIWVSCLNLAFIGKLFNSFLSSGESLFSLMTHPI